MELFWESSWRTLPAAVLATLGLSLVVRSGFRFRFSHRLPHGAPGKNLALMQSMRFVLAGGALLLIAAGWQFHVPVLIAIGALIGFEETIETSIAACALAEEKRRDELAMRRAQHG